MDQILGEIDGVTTKLNSKMKSILCQKIQKRHMYISRCAHKKTERFHLS